MEFLMTSSLKPTAPLFGYWFPLSRPLNLTYHYIKIIICFSFYVLEMSKYILAKSCAHAGLVLKLNVEQFLSFLFRHGPLLSKLWLCWLCGELCGPGKRGLFLFLFLLPHWYMILFWAAGASFNSTHPSSVGLFFMWCFLLGNKLIPCFSHRMFLLD